MFRPVVTGKPEIHTMDEAWWSLIMRVGRQLARPQLLYPLQRLQVLNHELMAYAAPVGVVQMVEIASCDRCCKELLE